MLNENPHADTHQDNSAQQFHPAAKMAAHLFPDPGPDKGEQKRGETDNRNYSQDVHLQDAEAHACRQSVDTGGHRESQQCRKDHGVPRYCFAVYFKGIVNHFSADYSKQYDRDPMIDSLYQAPERSAGQPADQWHGGLEHTEE